MNSTKNVFTNNRAGAPFPESDSIYDDPSGENISKNNLSFEVENSDCNSDDDVNSDDTRFPSLKLVCSPKTPPTIPANIWGYSVHSEPGPFPLKLEPIQIQSPILEFKQSSTTFVEEIDVCALACDNSESTLNFQSILQDTQPSFIFPQLPSDYLSQDQKLCHDSINGFQPEDCKNDQLHITPTDSLHYNITSDSCVTLPVDLVIANTTVETHVVDAEPIRIDSAPDKCSINLSDKDRVMQSDAHLVVNTAELDKEIVMLHASLMGTRTSEGSELTGSFGIETSIQPSFSNTSDLSSELKDSTLNNVATVYVKNMGVRANNASSTDAPEQSLNLNTANDYISSIKSLLFPGLIAECNEIDSTDVEKPEAIKSTASLLDILTGGLSVSNTNPIQSPILVPKRNRTEVESERDVYCETHDNTNNSAQNCLRNLEHMTHTLVPDAGFSDCKNYKKCDVHTDKGNSINNLRTEVVKVEYLSDMILPPTIKLLPELKCDTVTMADAISYAQSSTCMVRPQDINTSEEITVNDISGKTQSTLEYVSSNPAQSSFKINGLNTSASCSYVEVPCPGIKTHLEIRETVLGPDLNQVTDISSYNLQIPGKNIIDFPKTCFIPIESESSVLSEDAEVTTCLSNTNPNQIKSPIACRESAACSVVYSPPLFSDEEDYENTSSVKSSSRPPSRVDTNGCRTVEQRRLKQIQESLIGVFPPPSVTMPQLGVDDMLKLLKESNVFLKPVSSTAPNVENKERMCDRLEQAMESVWPDAKFVLYPDIYYNNGSISEKFELLSLKYSQRYVGCETASSCNIWSSFSSTNCSNMRNKRLGAGHSPGRRLSHLARRRKAFSRDSLIAHNNVPKIPVAERRQIVVNKKSSFKLVNSQGQNGSIPAIGAGPMTHKRALFQSPDNLKKALQIKSNSASKRKNETHRAVAQSYKRALFSSGAKHSNFPSNSKQKAQPEVDKQRSRDDSHSVASSSKRKLVFGTSDANMSGSSQEHIGSSTSGRNGMQTNSASGKETSGVNKKHTCVSANSSSCVLSSAHKKKLLWAVAEALRGKGINIRHASFKHYASSLARTCRILLPAAMKAINGSTSEIMLQLANQQIANILLCQDDDHSVGKS